MKTVEIEKGVKRVADVGANKYPWQKLDVDDSIRFNKKNTASAHAKRASEKFAPKKFEAGVDSNGTPRVWRVE